MKSLIFLLALTLAFAQVVQPVFASQTVEMEHFSIEFELLSEEELQQEPAPLVPAVESLPVSSFTFTVSKSQLIVPDVQGAATEDTIVLSVDGSNEVGYQISALEKTPFVSFAQDLIPPTSCNGGNDTCTASMAKKWDNGKKFGFGYALKGDIIPADFIDETYFRPFALNKNIVLANRQNPTGKDNITMKLRINTPASQPEGNYQTVIRLIAFPNL
ncbi:hypothetical protein KC726_02465 [Candidatus Woesebacteria bacterium]|nr:hypothetical protein [Candidatus Woesebacteria bacterium]